MLFIIDSIPLINDPEDWNQVSQEDIADISVITQADSLKMLGWEQVGGIIFIFTKSYRSRPDSIKKIPSLKQMVMKEGQWNFRDVPYTGRYIDYYNNGSVQNEGWLKNGKINGELIVYYKTGIKKSVTNYKDGIRHGEWRDYYQNSTLMRVDDFINGVRKTTGKSYFINGLIKDELKPRKATIYDTAIAYYSTGKIRHMSFTATGEFHPGKKETELNKHTTMFYHHLNTGDIKEANKDLYKIWLIDSTNIDTYFKTGFLFTNEFRFADAISQFDKALAIEPLMREALEQRAIARIRAYRFADGKIPFKEKLSLTLEDIMLIPEDDEMKVCRDIILADDIDPGVNYNNKAVPTVILNYCKKKTAR